jgi:cytochrome c-type biogenesis protein CcmH/NrfG
METREPRFIWTPARVYVVAGFCLLLGLSLGYVLHSPVSGPQPSPAAVRPAAATSALPLTASQAPNAHLPLQNPPEVAAKAASSVIEKLKTDPKNFDLLRQAGNIYMYSRVFSGAVGYYKRALDVRNDLAVRNDYANALYYTGDIDAALGQYKEILKSDPGNDSALFNRGMVLWEGKGDPQGAVESWQTLLKLHPDHPQRARIEAMIARASEHAQRAR